MVSEVNFFLLYNSFELFIYIHIELCIQYLSFCVRNYRFQFRRGIDIEEFKIQWMCLSNNLFIWDTFCTIPSKYMPCIHAYILVWWTFLAMKREVIEIKGNLIGKRRMHEFKRREDENRISRMIRRFQNDISNKTWYLTCE